jgi:hypothetical protein
LTTAKVTAAVLLASLVTTSAASAAEGKGEIAPGGSAGSQPSGGQESGGTGIEVGERTNPDVANAVGTAYKPWEVGVVFTTHRLVFQGDLAGGYTDGAATNCNCIGGVTSPNTGSEPGSGSAVNKQVNDYELYARYDLTKHDRIGVRAYVYEYFLADQGENGIRFDDMVFTYSHEFDLPKKFRLQTSLWVTAPTSYLSQLEGTVTTFIPRLELDRRFGPVSVDLRTYDTIFIQRYDSWAGSGGFEPTNLNSWAQTLGVEFHMPFHEPLSVGVDIFNEYLWYNNIQSGINPNGTNSSGNSTKSAGVENGGSQPMQQSYGWDAFVRYILPDLVGFKSDLTLAYSFGDPTVGYSSVLQDGVGHVFLGYRHNSEMYLSLAVRY